MRRIKRGIIKHFNCVPWLILGVQILRDGNISPYADITCDTKEDLEFVKAAVDAYLGWRDINESLPEPGKHVLLSFKNEGLTIPDIGTYEVDEQGNGAFYPDDSDVTYASVGVCVNAWMSLPKLYKREEEKQNEAD